ELQEFDSERVLTHMRTWIAEQEDINEVWLERLYFDGLRSLRVHGFATRPEDKELAIAKLVDFVPTIESRRSPPIDPDAAEPKPVKDAGPIVLDLLPNIGKHLRDRVPKAAACDGLRIDRCYYDVNGVFRVDGLADRAGQAPELTMFLFDDDKVPFDRKRQLADRWYTGRET